MTWLLSLLGGGVVEKFTGPLLDAYKAKLAADNDATRLAAERDIQRLEAARDLALAEAGDRWSATRLGRWLIVVPWGLWWAYGCLIQIANPLLGWHLVVVALPPGWDATAMILVPAIVLGDAAALATRRIGR